MYCSGFYYNLVCLQLPLHSADPTKDVSSYGATLCFYFLFRLQRVTVPYIKYTFNTLLSVLSWSNALNSWHRHDPTWSPGAIPHDPCNHSTKTQHSYSPFSDKKSLPPGFLHSKLKVDRDCGSTFSLLFQLLEFSIFIIIGTAWIPLRLYQVIIKLPTSTSTPRPTVTIKNPCLQTPLPAGITVYKNINLRDAENPVPGGETIRPAGGNPVPGGETIRPAGRNPVPGGETIRPPGKPCSWWGNYPATRKKHFFSLPDPLPHFSTWRILFLPEGSLWTPEPPFLFFQLWPCLQTLVSA